MEDLRTQAIDYLTFLNGDAPTEEEIGYTEKFGPRDWRFISKVN